MTSDNWDDSDEAPVEYLSVTDDDKLWALLAHLAGLLVLVAAPANLIAPLILFLVYKDKSRYVAFHALQSFYFQLAIVAVALLFGILSFVTMGLGLLIAVPVWIVLAIAGIVYPVVAAVHAQRGEIYEYAFVGRLAREHMDL